MKPNFKKNSKNIIVKLISLILTLFLFSIICFGQKAFRVDLQFPTYLDLTKLSIAYDDGKTQIQIKNPVFKNGKLTISELFYSKYAALILRYPKKMHLNYGNSFFLSDKPAKIFFKEADSTGSPFDNYNLTNAYDFKAEKDQMKKNDFKEIKNLEDFIDSIGEKFGQPFDSLLKINWNNFNKQLSEKDLQYISQTGNSYYSFWFFRRNFNYLGFVTEDSVLSFFNANFPNNFKNSVEGNTITSILNGKILVKKGSVAPDFMCKAMDGNAVSLNSFRDKKYVLLTFWATWCGPCIQEIPILKAIREKYSTKNLEIISVSYQSSSYRNTADFIKKEKMNWINIYNDADLINAWGGNKTIPRVYLIDKLGKIVYERIIDDPDSPELPRLMQYLNQL